MWSRVWLTSLKDVAEDALLVDVGGAVPALVAELELTLLDASACAVADTAYSARVRHADLDLLRHQAGQSTANGTSLRQLRVLGVRAGAGAGVLLHRWPHTHQP